MKTGNIELRVRQFIATSLTVASYRIIVIGVRTVHTLASAKSLCVRAYVPNADPYTDPHPSMCNNFKQSSR